MAKTIALTGASRGMGLALARVFTRQGHVVEGCSRSGRVAGDDRRAPDFRLEPVDISNDRDVSRWAKTVIGRGHVPDILICNAGVINDPAPLWDIPSAEVRDVINTNVLGTAYTLQAFLPAMIRRGAGIIVALSSGWGRSADAEMAPYCASKWAVEGLTLSLAKELPAGMAAVTLNPGIVATAMLEKCWPGRSDGYETPEAWAERAAVFILGLTEAENGAQLTVPAP
jgi:NAD(P)-dependent dehydrogenase (short-subunit alcohol dehydrogenase family)